MAKHPDLIPGENVVTFAPSSMIQQHTGLEQQEQKSGHHAERVGDASVLNEFLSWYQQTDDAEANEYHNRLDYRSDSFQYKNVNQDRPVHQSYNLF